MKARSAIPFVALIATVFEICLIGQPQARACEQIIDRNLPMQKRTIDTRCVYIGNPYRNDVTISFAADGKTFGVYTVKQLTEWQSPVSGARPAIKITTTTTKSQSYELVQGHLYHLYWNSTGATWELKDEGLKN